MDAPTEYYVLRSTRDRSAELRAQADAVRLTRTLAERHAALFPRVRRLGAGLTGLAVSSPSRPVATPRGLVRRHVRPTADTGPSSAAALWPCCPAPLDRHHLTGITSPASPHRHHLTGTTSPAPPHRHRQTGAARPAPPDRRRLTGRAATWRVRGSVC